MRKILTILFVLSTFMAACAPATPPAPTPDLEATISVMSATSIAATLAALPTNTAAPTETPLPTSTPEPIITNTPLPTETLVPTITMTQAEFTGCFIPTGASSLTAPFKLENYTKKKIEIYINGVTKNGDHKIHCAYVLEPNETEIFTIWFGDYTYIVIGKKQYTGGFFVNDSDKATMRVNDKGVQIGPFP